MKLSRRGILAGLGVAGGVGAVGFAGAATVTNGGPLDDDGDASNGDDGDPEAEDGETASVPVDPDAAFEARLVPANGDGTDGDGGDTDDAPFLFDASDLDRVQTGAGNGDDSSEHLVYVSLSADGRADFRDRLADAGATEEPGRFAVSMTLAGEEVRRVDLDTPTVAALTDEEWGSVLELPFATEVIAQDVYESLAADEAESEADESG